MVIGCKLSFQMTQGCETHERTNILTDKRLKKIDMNMGL